MKPQPLSDNMGKKPDQGPMQEPEQSFASLLSNLPGMVYHCRNDRDWTMNFVSQGCKILTDYAPEDLIDNQNVSYNDLIHPDDRERVWDCVQTAVGQQAHYELEYRIQTRNGMEKWVWERGSGHFSDGGKLLYLEGFITDVTDRKLAEIKIFEHEEQLSTTLNSIGDAVMSSDTHGCVTTMNPVAEALTGWTLDNAIGQPLCEIFRIINEDTRKTVESPVDLVLASGNIVGLANHTLLIAKDGREIPIADSGAPIRNSEGEITGVVLVFRDQTGERESHLALEKSEAQYRSLFDNMPTGFVLYEMITDDGGKPIDFRIVQANPAFEDVIGIKLEDALGRTIKELSTEADPFWIEIYGNVVQTGEAQEFEHYAKTQKRYLQVRCFSPGENQVAVMYTNISDRRQTEQQLHDLSEIQGMLLNNSTLGIALVRQRRFEWVNSRMCEMVDMTEEALCGASTRLFYLDEKQFEQTGQKIYARLGAGQRFDDKILLNRHDGTPFWCRLIGTSINPKCPNEGSLWMLDDITEKMEAETQLLRLSTAIEQTPEAVFITDLEGRIQYVNAAFESITGYTSAEALGKNSNILKSGEHDDIFYADLWTTIVSGRIWKGRMVNRRKDGTFYTEEATISPVKDAGGNITNYVAVNRDITDELMMEEELRQSQKMEAVGQLAGGIAHDFNNILQAILGFGQLLQVGLDNDSQEYSNAEEIVKATRRASKLTSQLLTFSRKQSTQCAHMNLNAAVHDTQPLVEMLVGEKFELALDLEKKLYPVWADHGQMTQIIMNLAVNARDAMPEGGRMTIATDNLTFGKKDLVNLPEAKPGKYVCLSITDTGCGMNNEVRKRLFEPFFTTKAVGQGSGLGLSVVYGIIKQNKGWINVYSELDLGSTFKIYIPALSQSGTAMEAIEPDDESLTHKRILLVEDDNSVGTMVIEVLESAGYEVVFVTSAEDALVQYKNQDESFDLLMSDMILPAMNGGELADIVRTMHPALPILLYSGYRDVESRWNHLHRKDYFFTHKPFTTMGLLTTIKNILNNVIS